MIPFGSHLFALLFVVWIAVIYTVAGARQRERARDLAVVWAALLMVVSGTAGFFWNRQGAIVSWSDPSLRLGSWSHPPLLALDALNVALLPTSAGCFLAILLTAGRDRLNSARIAAVLLQLLGVWLLFLAQDIVLMVIGWALSLLPRFVLRRPGRVTPRFDSVVLQGSLVVFAAAVATVVYIATQAGLAHPTSLAELTHARPSSPLAGPAIVLLLVAVAAREGIFPFHGWTPSLAEHRGPVVLAMVAAPQVGVFTLARVGMMVFPAEVHERIPVVGDVALVAAVYCALAGLGAKSLRRAFGWIVSSQASLVFVGLGMRNTAGVGGAMVLWISVAFCLTGLGIAVARAEARLGTVNLLRWWGLDARAPLLGAAFLVFGLACVGLPGTLGFLSDDMVVSGVLQEHAGVGVAVVLTTGLNAFLVMRAYMRVFCGPADAGNVSTDVRGGERVALVALLALVVGLGVFPQVAVGARQAATEMLLRAAAAAPPSP
jgi:NADH-quinone oxidoreductase subunit M